MKRRETVLLAFLCCAIPSILLLFPTFEVWGEFGWIEMTGFNLFYQLKYKSRMIDTCTIKTGSFSYFYRSFTPLLPYIIITFCYTRIIMTVKKIQKTVHQHTPKKLSECRQKSVDHEALEHKNSICSRDQESSLNFTVGLILVR